MDDNDELAARCEALMRWFDSQDIDPGEAVEVMAFTIAVVIQRRNGLAKNKKLEILNVIAKRIKSVWTALDDD